MRLIDADALIDTLGVSDEDINFREMLDEAPSIEIIRCRECKYWTDNEDYDCEIHSGAWQADDYCSYGERREP